MRLGGSLAGGHRLAVADLAKTLGEVSGTTMVPVPVPDTALRAAGSIFDFVGPYLPFDNPITAAGMQTLNRVRADRASAIEPQLAGLNTADRQIDVAPGEIRYVEVAMNAGMLGPHCSVEEVSPQQGQAAVLRSKRVTPH